MSELLPKVAVPTLIMHKREDQMQPFEAGRELAAGIPGARFCGIAGPESLPARARSRNGADARRNQAVREKLKAVV